MDTNSAFDLAGVDAIGWTALANVTGWAAISLPLGMTSTGLPIGVQLYALACVHIRPSAAERSAEL